MYASIPIKLKKPNSNPVLIQTNAGELILIYDNCLLQLKFLTCWINFSLSGVCLSVYLKNSVMNFYQAVFLFSPSKLLAFCILKKCSGDYQIYFNTKNITKEL